METRADNPSDAVTTPGMRPGSRMPEKRGYGGAAQPRGAGSAVWPIREPRNRSWIAPPWSPEPLQGTGKWALHLKPKKNQPAEVVKHKRAPHRRCGQRPSQLSGPGRRKRTAGNRGGPKMTLCPPDTPATPQSPTRPPGARRPRLTRRPQGKSGPRRSPSHGVGTTFNSR